MLVKQSFRVHQIILHERKKVISSQSPEIDSLTFWCQQSRRKLVLDKSRFYKKYVHYANKDSGLICFLNWNVGRLPPSRFWFMFQYNRQELYYLFPQLHSEAKKILSRPIVHDCSDCHRHWLLHSFYLWLVFSPCFFHSFFSLAQYMYRSFIPLLQCCKLYSQMVVPFPIHVSIFHPFITMFQIILHFLFDVLNVQ